MINILQSFLDVMFCSVFLRQRFSKLNYYFLVFSACIAVCFFVEQSFGSGEPDYILRAGDVISIQVFGQDELAAQQQISNQGFISMGLIGQVQIDRLTVNEAQMKIKSAFVDKRFLRDPQVIIGVVSSSPRLVSVLGQVNKPGTVQLPSDAESLTVARVISMVGDFRGIAKKDSIRVVRKDKDGGEVTIILDLSGIGKKNSRNEDIDFLIQPDDVIYVPERVF